MTEPAAPRPGEWKRPALLFLALLSFSTVRPTVLIGLPFALLVLTLPVRRMPVLLLAGAAAFFVLAGDGRGGLWYLERGWSVLAAGWFAAVTLRFPRTGFLDRALSAVLGAVAVAAVLFAVQPGSWGVFDLGMAERMRLGAATALQTLEVVQGAEGTVSPALIAAVYGAAETQTHLFPALLALGTMAGLAVAWWLYVRVGLGAGGALGPLAGFRFSDQLVWIFLGGVALLVAGVGEAWSRAGANAAVFMGTLYALRGAGVVLHINGGISVLGLVAVALGLLFMAPVLVVGAMVIGLADTWLDLRAKAGSRTA